MKQWFILTLCLIATRASGAASNYTFNYKLASYCKEHVCRHGYRYETFYSVQSEGWSNIGQGSDVVFEMHLAILAPNNGHILLSSVPRPTGNDPVYEIVVGGGGNSFSELRRNLRRNAKTSVPTLGILSPIEFVPFYIRVTEDGDIEFGREGQSRPILTYTDVDPIPIKYFSFASWQGTEAKFLYDCPVFIKNDSVKFPKLTRNIFSDCEMVTTIESPKSIEVKRNLSNTEEIKQILFKKNPIRMPPHETVTILLAVDVTHVRYNVFTSKLTTGLAVIALWTDLNVIWDPIKYNVTTIQFREGELWKPSFYVYNSDDIRPLEARNPELITAAFNGELIFHFRTVINTWCTDQHESSKYNRWPQDVYDCSIVIGPWQAHENIKIQTLQSNNLNYKIFAELDKKIETDWDVTWNQSVVNHSEWNKMINMTDNLMYQSDRYIIQFHMRRRASSYLMVFYTPLVVLMTFVLMSFWSEPLQLVRVWFYAGSIVIICMGLCYVDYLMPCHTVPYILILYTSVLVGVLIALMVQVVLMTEYVQECFKAAWVQSLVTKNLLRTVFCLTPLRTPAIYESINEGYFAQDDDDSGVMTAPRNGNIEEMEEDNPKYGKIEEIAEIIDKTMFAIYSIVFAIMLAV